jgi:hypothetical protein
VEAPRPDVVGEAVQADRSSSFDEFLHTQVQDSDRGPNVFLDDRGSAATFSETPLVIGALDPHVSAADRLDVLAHRQGIQLKAEVVVCVGRLAESHPENRRGTFAGARSFTRRRGRPV